jgi:hypothetical protein
MRKLWWWPRVLPGENTQLDRPLPYGGLGSQHPPSVLVPRPCGASGARAYAAVTSLTLQVSAPTKPRRNMERKQLCKIVVEGWRLSSKERP